MAVDHTSKQAAVLKRLVPLNNLKDKQLQELLAQINLSEAKPGTILFHQGDRDQQSIYILAGTVSFSSNDKVVDQLSGGSDIARYAIAHQFPRKFTARTETQVLFLRIDSRLLGTLLAQSQGSGYEVREIESEADGHWMAQLLRVPLFQMMSAANLQRIMMRIEQVSVPGREEVFHQGDEGDYYYIIHRGRCEVIKHERAADPGKLLAELGPGASFGEDALLSGNPRSCSIRMKSDGILLRLSKKDFLDLVNRPLSKTLSYQDAKQQVASGAIWLDVRPQKDYEHWHLAHSINLPFELLRYQIESLASDENYIAYCEDEGLSSAAAFLLTERGFKVAILSRGLASVPDAVRTTQKQTEQTSAPAPTPVPSTPEIEQTSVDQKEIERLTAELATVQQALEQAQTQLKQQQQALEQAQQREKQLQQQLEQAKPSAPTPSTNTNQQGRDRELENLKRSLYRAQKELEETEQQQQQEVDEMYQQWEKRLGHLESDLAMQTERANQAEARCKELEQQLAKVSS